MAITKETLNLLFDDTFTIALLEDDGETPVPLSSIADVRVLFKVNEVEVLKFKKVAAAGYKQWTPHLTETNKLECKVERDETSLFPNGLLKVELLIIENDTDYEDNEKYHYPIVEELGVVKNTLIKDIIAGE